MNTSVIVYHLNSLFFTSLPRGHDGEVLNWNYEAQKNLPNSSHDSYGWDDRSDRSQGRKSINLFCKKENLKT